jgi:hypothetical protein
MIAVPARGKAPQPAAFPARYVRLFPVVMPPRGSFGRHWRPNGPIRIHKICVIMTLGHPTRRPPLTKSMIVQIMHCGLIQDVNRPGPRPDAPPDYQVNPSCHGTSR